MHAMLVFLKHLRRSWMRINSLLSRHTRAFSRCLRRPRAAVLLAAGA